MSSQVKQTYTQKVWIIISCTADFAIQVCLEISSSICFIGKYPNLQKKGVK